jgi:excisionase family DNA binding protein
MVSMMATNNTGPEPLLTVEDVAYILNVNVDYVRFLFRQRVIPAFKIYKGEWRTTRKALDGYIERKLQEAVGDEGEG